WSCVALALGLACGPGMPGETMGSTGGATTTGPATDGAMSTSSSTTGTGEATTASPTTGTAATGASTAPSTGEGATTEALECVVDPSQNLCSEGCDPIVDCCKCEGQTLVPGDAKTCAIGTGIVAAKCWAVSTMRLDGMPLAEGGNVCGEPDVMWVQYTRDGEQIVEL